MLDKHLMLHKKVKELLEKNSTNEQIYLALISQGHSVADIDKELQKLKNNNNLENNSKKDSHSKKDINPDVNQENLLNVVISAFVIGFMGIGFTALIAANWSWLNDIAKLLILVSIMLLSYVAAFVYWEVKEKQTLVSTIFFAVGITVFGLTLQLTGQIFNLPVSWVGGLILWFAGSIALASVLYNRILQYMSLLILAVSWFVYPFTMFESLSTQVYRWQPELYLLFLALSILAVVYGQFKTEESKPITII